MEKIDSNQYFMDMFLEYFNNFLTYEYFAEYFALDVDQARSIIDHGRKLYQAQFDQMRPIIVPDAAIRRYNDKYAATIAKSIALATVKPKPCAPVIDEDALYIQYNIGEGK